MTKTNFILFTAAFLLFSSPAADAAKALVCVDKHPNSLAKQDACVHDQVAAHKEVRQTMSDHGLDPNNIPGWDFEQPAAQAIFSCFLAAETEHDFFSVDYRAWSDCATQALQADAS